MKLLYFRVLRVPPLLDAAFILTGFKRIHVNGYVKA